MSISLLPMDNLDEWEHSGLITPPEIAFVSTPKDQLKGLAMVRRSIVRIRKISVIAINHSAFFLFVRCSMFIR